MADEPSFEQILQELERRVRQLEAGDLPLDRALALFEEGVSLAKACQDQLDAAEQRVTALSRGAHGLEERPFPERESSS